MHELLSSHEVDMKRARPIEFDYAIILDTVEPRYNDPRYNDIPGITIIIKNWIIG